MADPLLVEYQLAHGLSDETLADLLTERLGRPITPGGVQRFKRYPDHSVPPSWLAALELEPRGPAPRPEPPAGEFPPIEGTRLGDGPPPDSTPSSAGTTAAEKVLALDYAAAYDVLVFIYSSVGYGLATILHDPQIDRIFKTKVANGKTPPENIADDWCALARVDERARKLLATLTMGGPAGKLAVDHLILIVAILTRPRPDGSIATAAPETILGLHPNNGGAESPVDEARAAPQA